MTTETAAAPAVETPKAAAKAAPRKAAKGKAKAAAKAKPGANGDLTGNETKILTALAKRPQTRNELRKSTGIEKGYSRILGASTKEGGGAAGANSLEGRKLVKAEVQEGERALVYRITAAGEKALKKAKA